MTQYNLVRNGSLQSVTTSGTGNVSLSWTQLESLMDGTTTSGGISLTTSGVLYMDADLSQRIKVDGIRLYASDLTKSANIKFYYKNETNDSYILLSTSVSTYYYTTIADPSAPRYVRATVSGVAIDLYEFEIFNDDVIVAFGSDGSQFAKYLDETPVGSEGTPETIALFNNSSLLTGMAADAYTVIDYTDSVADEYVKISSSQNGTYYGIEDGALIEDDKDSSTYKWSMGTLSGTEISGDNIIVLSPSTSGTYTTPIFKLDNQYNASYFITDGTAVSGTGSISYDANVYNGTIRIKSSDTAPVVVEEVYWAYFGGTDGNDGAVQKSIVYNDVTTDIWANVALDGSWALTQGTAVDRRTGTVAAVFKHSTVGLIKIYNRDGSLNYSTAQVARYRADVNIEFDKFGGLWAYGDFFGYLIHFDSVATIYELYDSGIDFLYDLAAEMDGDGVWYTDKVDGLLIHRDGDGDGTLLGSIVLPEPRAICGTLDNGCWVIDNTNEKAYRYNSSHSLVKTVTLDRTATRMATDMANGFWYISGNHVYHVTSGGTQNVDVEFNQPTKIKGGHNGCIVWSENQDYVKYLNNAGSVVRTFNAASMVSNISGYPALFSFRVEDTIDFQDTTNIIPATYDPVWGTNGSLEWEEVRKDGYFLPKYRYHRAEITVRGDAILQKLIMPPAIKTEDIQPQQSQDIYIKTDIPVGADVTDYSTRLKTWWGVEE